MVRVGAPRNTGGDKNPFEGQSTYKQDFTKMPGGLRYDPQQRNNKRLDSGPFDGTTTYNVDYSECVCVCVRESESVCACVRVSVSVRECV